MELFLFLHNVDNDFLVASPQIYGRNEIEKKITIELVMEKYSKLRK
jgi:hypothetical protein